MPVKQPQPGELEPIERASRDELQALQLQRLQQTLQTAYDKVPHYRRAFDAAGVHPSDCKSLADLTRFPFTTKKDLRENYPFGVFAVPREQVVRVHASSGTTGKPTVVGYTRQDIDTWADLVARSIRAAGGRPGDIVHVAYGYGLFTGGLGAHYGGERLGCTVIPMSGGNTEKQVQLITDFRPDIIMARSELPLSDQIRGKIALFCNVPKENVLQNMDVDVLYELPLVLEKEHFAEAVLKALHLEDEEHRAYFRALPIAELYMAVMDSYNMVYSDSKKAIIEAIIVEDHQKYVDDLQMIMKHHIVDENARDEIQMLMDRFVYFKDENHFKKPACEEKLERQQPMVETMPQIPMYQNLMIPQIGNMYFTLQCLNEKKDVVDEAYFSMGNIQDAITDYSNRQAHIKRFGLVRDGQFLPLMSTERGGFDEKN